MLITYVQYIPTYNFPQNTSKEFKLSWEVIPYQQMCMMSKDNHHSLTWKSDLTFIECHTKCHKSMAEGLYSMTLKVVCYFNTWTLLLTLSSTYMRSTSLRYCTWWVTNMQVLLDKYPLKHLIWKEYSVEIKGKHLRPVPISSSWSLVSA